MQEEREVRLKKRFRCACSITLMLAAMTLRGWAQERVRIGVVNGATLLKLYHKTQLADAHMEEQVAEFTGERDALLAEHRRLKREFETLRAESMSKALSEAAREKKKEQAEERLLEVMEFQGRIRDTAMNRRRQLEEEGRRMQRRLMDEIREAVRTYARSNGLQMVLDNSIPPIGGFEALLYSEPAWDVTTNVLAILNAQATPTNRVSEKAGPP